MDRYQLNTDSSDDVGAVICDKIKTVNERLITSTLTIENLLYLCYDPVYMTLQEEVKIRKLSERYNKRKLKIRMYCRMKDFSSKQNHEIEKRFADINQVLHDLKSVKRCVCDRRAKGQEPAGNHYNNAADKSRWYRP